ncbi:hypothetical protein, partial [Phaffia rhodozyma]
MGPSGDLSCGVGCDRDYSDVDLDDTVGRSDPEIGPHGGARDKCEGVWVAAVADLVVSVVVLVVAAVAEVGPAGAEGEEVETGGDVDVSEGERGGEGDDVEPSAAEERRVFS